VSCAPVILCGYVLSEVYWRLRWLDTVFKNSGVQHFDMFKLRIFRIYSADIGFFTYFDNSTFKLY
jgi:hypothetical protein